MSAPLSEQPADTGDQEPDTASPADAPSDSEPGLGDPGKLALAAERKARNAVEKTNKALLQKISELENASLSADEKAIKEAVDKAAAEATAAATAQWSARYQEATLRSIAAKILDEDQLEGWMASVHAPKFALDDGEIDEDKVMTTLTATFGRGRHTPPPVRQWGQYNNSVTPGTQPGAEGRAEAQRRFNKT